MLDDTSKRDLRKHEFYMSLTKRRQEDKQQSFSWTCNEATWATPTTTARAVDASHMNDEHMSLRSSVVRCWILIRLWSCNWWWSVTEVRRVWKWAACSGVADLGWGTLCGDEHSSHSEETVHVYLMRRLEPSTCKREIICPLFNSNRDSQNPPAPDCDPSTSLLSLFLQPKSLTQRRIWPHQPKSKYFYWRAWIVVVIWNLYWRNTLGVRTKNIKKENMIRLSNQQRRTYHGK